MLRKTSLLLVLSLAVALPLSAQGYFQVTQGAVRAAVPPLAGARPATEFYAYDSGQSRSGNELAEAGNMVLFLYREPGTQNLFLFFILNKAGTGTGGNVRLTLRGCPRGRTSWCGTTRGSRSLRSSSPSSTTSTSAPTTSSKSSGRGLQTAPTAASWGPSPRSSG